jgi:hypothetical protein
MNTTHNITTAQPNPGAAPAQHPRPDPQLTARRPRRRFGLATDGHLPEPLGMSDQGQVQPCGIGGDRAFN